ncbi:MAG: cytochrome c biogenesis protein CcsA [Ignavibacteriae bacterium]|nr:cytochrome c biogenesis protein CcsA [Ignavibacteriota bacterium]MCB9243979.1 cytochrome c biogenesis protein CcsA [Ignavibacteriales bacterium]
MIGKILVYIAFTLAVTSGISFFSVHRGKDKLIKYARIFFISSVIFILAISAFQMYNILTHQFQFTYVWEQSNRELGLGLLMSTFYSGQEGSFMLWTLLTSVVGLFLLNYVRKGDRLEPQVMSVFSLILAFLTFILILKSPFNYVWESFPEVPLGYIPPDGRGLNPLLQNFWMQIHPPTLFTGFSAMSVPFCFAIATLMQNKYDDWIKFSMPWLLFAGGILGLGIMMGGYWAYGVLGWGGYWAWDPVENSSLIPWIVIVAAIHTFLAQKRTGGYKKTNLVLCILAYLLVLYSTFLTRSGILGDSSVHSFVDPGWMVYWSLLAFIGVFILISIIAFAYRFKELKALSKGESHLLTRESALFVGSLTLCAAAIVVFAGTSWPILKSGTIDQDFYNRMNLPIAILIAFINGISILLKWKTTDEKNFFRELLFPLLLAVIVTVGLVIIGVQDFLFGLFALAALFAFFVNGEFLVNRIMKKKGVSGAFTAHIGIALLFLGVIASSRYSEEVNITLPLNQPADAFGYRLTYLGATEFDDPNNQTDTKYHFNVMVEKDGKQFLLQPIMYFSKFSNGVMKNPDIANLFTRDLYLSPMGLVEPEAFKQEDLYEFHKGETKKIGGMDVEFIDFDFGGIQMGGAEVQSGNFTVGGKIKVSDGKFTETIMPEVKYANGTPEYKTASMSGVDHIHFYLVKMNVNDPGAEDGATATIAVVNDTEKENNSTETESLVLTASIKPFINILWSGTVIMVLGFLLSIIKRRKELKS